LCYFVYYLCDMMCVCRILIKITYLVNYPQLENLRNSSLKFK